MGRKPKDKSPIKNGPAPLVDETVADTFEEKIEEDKLKLEEEKVQNEESRWKNRRKMAWISMWMLIFCAIAILFVVPEKRLPTITEPVSWIFISFTSIVGFYFGSATYAGVIGKK